jgi:hypothetical protein
MVITFVVSLLYAARLTIAGINSFIPAKVVVGEGKHLPCIVAVGEV